MLIRQEKSTFKKVQKIEGISPWVLGKSSQERSFFDILDRKECFKARKVKKKLFLRG